jgi:hypothetical protein
MNETKPTNTLLKRLVARCKAARVTRVVASTQYSMGMILAADGPNENGILFRDDGMGHAEREAWAEKLNAALANVQDEPWR